ncbi:hypothetical protein [Aurantiacibacter odishensis]|uniref:hypothetical protein n=1 Tax=Aurantiacibacter odishensis TaxID=1155476 RepID=UPI000E7171DF|nr:hypothetical protein [Aurantiacibacter odishensis]
MTDTSETLSGEARLKIRRNRFWTFCALGFAVAIVAGFVTGYAADLLVDGVLPGWSFFLMWGVALVSFTWFTWSYFRRVDELDLLDNLWASLIAFYFYFVAMPSWWLFHDLGLAPEVDHIAIYFATAVVMFAAYGLRKLGLR